MTGGRKLSRRALLGSGAAALALPPLGLLGLRGTGSAEEVVAFYLRHMLPGLAVPEADLQAFARDHLPRMRAYVSRPRYEAVLLMMRRPQLEAIAPDQRRSDYQWLSRDLMTAFLFSTDFFTAAATRPERTRYIAYADPYAVGCRNPLAQEPGQA